eukprot:COSAG02_NODE_2031_length_10066_cov_115.646333_2_plen_36_part_00
MSPLLRLLVEEWARAANWRLLRQHEVAVSLGTFKD